MTLLRGSINSLVRHSLADLGTVFDTAESWLAPVPGFIATILIHVLDTHTGDLRFVSAGHPPSVVFHPDGSHTFLEAGRRPVLGMPGPVPAIGTMPFPKGSVLVACTDGLLERRDRTLDEGLAALVSTVQPHLGDAAKDIATTIEASVDWTPSDDIAFVVLKHTNEHPDS